MFSWFILEVIILHSKSSHFKFALFIFQHEKATVLFVPDALMKQYVSDLVTRNQPLLRSLAAKHIN